MKRFLTAPEAARAAKIQIDTPKLLNSVMFPPCWDPESPLHECAGDSWGFNLFVSQGREEEEGEEGEEGGGGGGGGPWLAEEVSGIWFWNRRLVSESEFLTHIINHTQEFYIKSFHIVLLSPVGVSRWQ